MRGGAVAACPEDQGGGSGLVAWPVFKTATEKPSAAPVGSIPTRSRHRIAVAACLTMIVGPLTAQPPPAPADTTRSSPLAAPISSTGAFLRSLAVPGWGQARLDRKLTGALFITVEGLSLAMTMKTIKELKYLTRVGADSARIASKRSQRQDWLILLGFNHLFAGLEAFVATELHQFPGDVRFRVIPGGWATEVAIPFRVR